MKKLLNRSFAPLLVLGILAIALPTFAKEKSEEQLVNDLGSSKERTVVNAIEDIQKLYPTSSTALPIIRKLLGDSRKNVHLRALRTLGELHTPTDADDIKAIVAMLKEGDVHETADVLKYMRGLQCQSAVPDIKECLKSSDTHVLRDACRTLSVVGDKSVIPDIQPLLQYPDLGVQKDALDAINLLKAKP